jgi:hypothetical protein
MARFRSAAIGSSNRATRSLPIIPPSGNRITPPPKRSAQCRDTRGGQELAQRVGEQRNIVVPLLSQQNLHDRAGLGQLLGMALPKPRLCSPNLFASLLIHAGFDYA